MLIHLTFDSLIEEQQRYLKFIPKRKELEVANDEIMKALASYPDSAKEYAAYWESVDKGDIMNVVGKAINENKEYSSVLK